MFGILCILFFCLSSSCADSKGQDPDRGLGAMKNVLVCTACHRIMARVGKDVTSLIQKNRKWNKVLRKKFSTMLTQSCAIQDDFPADNEYTLKGCDVFISQQKKKILSEVKKHLDPQAEEYEEDIDSKQFCTEVLQACHSGMKSIDEHMNQKPPSLVTEQDKYFASRDL